MGHQASLEPLTVTGSNDPISLAILPIGKFLGQSQGISKTATLDQTTTTSRLPHQNALEQRVKRRIRVGFVFHKGRLGQVSG